MSLFCCPICAEPLTRSAAQYLCPKGHCYDIAKEGYVHLLPANRMHSKAPGDDKGMAAARNRFLSAGYYGALRDLLCQLAVARTDAAPALLDSGCGEGYYTAGLLAALTAAGKHPRVAGVDLSKPSLKWAARRAPEAEFGVASVYHLPVAARSIDLLVNCFSPLALEEFRRVLKPGGLFLYVVPAARHLWELKELLYELPYLNREETEVYPGFALEAVETVEAQPSIAGGDLADLFRMTPYYWKTPQAGVARLAAQDGLRVTAAFRVLLFRRTEEPPSAPA